MPPLQAIKYKAGELLVLDQLLLPHTFHYDAVYNCEEAFTCIKSMRVRGAPAIAIVAILSVAVELRNGCCDAQTPEGVIAYIDGRLDYLKESRPTAVDLGNAIDLFKRVIRDSGGDGSSAQGIIQEYISGAEAYMARDLHTNTSIGEMGSQWLVETVGARKEQPISVLTHCNTGSLATSGHGTALGIIRTLHQLKLLKHAFCTETRPYNQGSRLTAFELMHEEIPATLVTDSMAGALFARRKGEMNIAAVIVGADRVVRNGDTANKIGTYSLAVLAKQHGIKFIVAAPRTSIDLRTPTGGDIKIEERAKDEVTQISGPIVNADGTIAPDKVARVATADQRIGVWNPAFDVTPHDFVDAIVTEAGVIVKNPEGKFDLTRVMAEKGEDFSGGEIALKMSGALRTRK